MSSDKSKIAIALSGGVDSAVAAKILKDEGYQLVGFFLKLWSDPKCNTKGENRCCDYEALEDARRVAANLNIPFYVIDAKEEFKKEVVDYFINEYKNLRTPNPCVVCNQKIKFDLLLKKALQIGCDYLATGHYARIENAGNPKISFDKPSPRDPLGLRTPSWQDTSNKQILNSKIQNPSVIPSPIDAAQGEESHHRVSGSTDSFCLGNDGPLLATPKGPLISGARYLLLTGLDQTKDQSYNLYRLNQEQLLHIIFPLGEMTKKEVRAKALKWDLPVKEKAESQEICFFGDSDYRDFLRRYLPKDFFDTGEIVDSAGKIIGRHEGLVDYTIGQRKGVDQIHVSPLKDTAQDTASLSLGKERSLPLRSFRATRDTVGSSLQFGGQAGQSPQSKKPLYVIGFDVKKNQLIVGEDSEVYKKEMTVSDLHWIGQKAVSSKLKAESLSVKIRSQAQKVKCRITVCHSGLDPESIEMDSSHDPKGPLRGWNDSVMVSFDQPQRAITRGQSAVFYLGDEVIGGGIIQ